MRKNVEHHDVHSLRGVEASKLLEPRLVCNRPLQVRRTTARKGGLDYDCKTDHLSSAESFSKSILMFYHVLSQAYVQCSQIQQYLVRVYGRDFGTDVKKLTATLPEKLSLQWTAHVDHP